MRTFLYILLLLASIASADEMPRDSKQFEAGMAIADKGIGFQMACPPEINRQGVQVMCVPANADEYEAMHRIDSALIDEVGLKPVEATWQYLDGQSRFVRSYTFLAGDGLEVVVSQDDFLVAYIFYIPR